MAGVVKSASAEADLVEHFVHLFENAGEAVADRFLDSAEKSFAMIEVHPKIGRALKTRSAQLAGVRKWGVTGFENHLIFYMPSLAESAVLRVLHRARNWWQLLEVKE